ncbi:MAG: EpsG family protein [Pseudomonadota bacterium]
MRFILIFIISTVLGYVAGFRPFGIGRDFLNYSYFYALVDFNDISFFRFEPGFVISAKIAKTVFEFDYMTFAFVLMTVSLCLKFFVLSSLKNYIPAFAFYIACWFPLQENTQVRLAVATSIIFLATKYLFQNRWKTFLALSAIAATFHITIVVCAAVIFTAHFLGRYKVLYSLAICVVPALVIPYLIDLIFPIFVQINLTLGGIEPGSEDINIFSLTNIFATLFLIASVLSGSVNSHSNRVFFLVSCAGFACLIGFMSIPIVAHRLKDMMLVYMTFIAFEYRMSTKTLPQAIIATLLAAGSLYANINLGLFSD